MRINARNLKMKWH